MSDPPVRTVQLQHWLELIRAGDQTAQDELLRGFCVRLEHLARKMLRRFPQVRRWAETDDVLQNALLRLLRSLQKVHPASIRDFLRLAALEMRRELLDLTRHFSDPLKYGGNLVDSCCPVLEQAPSIPEDQEDLERWQAFHEGVATLPAEEREVVSLVYYHGWTQLQVAELFQVSERTIRRRWEVALLKLNQRLQLPEAEG